VCSGFVSKDSFRRDIVRRQCHHCESFAFKVLGPDFALAVFKGLAHAPGAHVLRLKNEDLSRDRVVVAAMIADPLIADETQPIQTLAAVHPPRYG
jgi:hypothetical protein